MLKTVNIYLIGGENAGWALDTDAQQLQTAFRNIKALKIVSKPENADVIYAVWWQGLASISSDILRRKYVICNMCSRPFQEFTQPRFSMFLPLIDLVVAQSSEAAQELRCVGIKCVHLSYALDTSIFYPLEQKDLLRAKYNLPQDAYILGNFHRDSEGVNLALPKLAKGPDILFEMLALVWRVYRNVHVMLAGPRRHWLRSQLEQAHIPYTFIGQITEGDDWNINILTLPQINELYQCLDLAVVSSRWEGAPRTLLEAAATKTKIISTKVGIASDLLSKKCLYVNFIDGANLIQQDIASDALADTLEPNYASLQRHHTSETLIQCLKEIFTEHVYPNLPYKISLPSCQFFEIDSEARTKQAFHIGVWHEFFKPPYGGGNQFMLALTKMFRQWGHHVAINLLNKQIDGYILNSVHFDVEKFRKARKKRKLRIVHRIDGPIQLIRGKDKELDDLCQQLNREFADFTIVQSIYTLTRHFQLGNRFVRPVIIRNAVDDEIFNRNGKIPFNPERKIRIISTSWSDNPRKGGAVYQWLDEHLDFDYYEYTFVGRLPEAYQQMKHIRVMPPVPSEELAAILKQHDIYLTASQNDPCSNALLEALACGLPTIFANDGGHPELVGTGGLGFEQPEEIPALLQTLIEHYDSFQRLIVVEPLDKIADKYEEVLRLATQSRPASRRWSLRQIWEKCRTMFLKRS